MLSSEPAGKPLRDCARGECFVTYDAGQEDDDTRRRHGVIGLRRYKLLRIATEAHDQGIDLTQEGLARILGAGLKTVKRDIAYFRTHGIYLPTRGQQKGLGPIVPHEVEAVRLTLEGQSDWEVSRRILLSPGMVTRILGAFGRVIAFLRAGRDPEDVAYLVGMPRRLVDEYRKLEAGAARDPAWRARLEALVPGDEPEGAGEGDDVRVGHEPTATSGEAGSRRRQPPIFDEQVKVLRRDVFDYLLDVEIRKAMRYKLPLALVTIEPARPDGLWVQGRALAAMTLSEHLRETLRATDLIGRAAVARYLVLLPVADVATVRGLFERLLQAHSLPSGARFVAGAACFPAHASRTAELLAASERALAAARDRGRPYVLAFEAAGGSGAA